MCYCSSRLSSLNPSQVYSEGFVSSVPLANDWTTKNGNSCSKQWVALPDGKQSVREHRSWSCGLCGALAESRMAQPGRWGAGCFSTWSPQGSYWIVFASFFGHVVTGWPFLQINYHKTRSWRSLWLRSLQSCSVIRIMSRLLLPLTQSHPQADPLN